MRVRVLFVLGLLLPAGLGGWAQEGDPAVAAEAPPPVAGQPPAAGAEAPPPAAEAPAAAVGEGEAGEYPGSYEVVPRSLRLAEEAEAARREIARLEDAAPLRQAAQAAERRQEALGLRLEAAATERATSGDLLEALRRDADRHRQRLDGLLRRISERYRRLDALRQSWEERREFWRGWRQQLAGDPQYPPLEDELRLGVERSELVAAEAAAASAAVLSLQLEVQGYLQQSQALLGRAEERLGEWRRSLFEPGEPPLPSARYLDGWRPELGGEIAGGAAAAARGEGGFLAAERWRIALQVLVAIAGALLAGLLRRAGGGKEGRGMPVRHPIAVGVLLSVLAVAPFYELAPPLWSLAQGALLAGSAALVARSVFDNRRKRRVLYLLAAVYLTLQAAAIVSLPLPVFRLLLALLGLGAAPFLLLLARREAAAAARLTPFAVALRLGAAAVGVIFLAQLLGYHALSVWLLDAAVSSAFLVLVVTFLIRLVRGVIYLGLESEPARRLAVIRRVGPELSARFSRLAKGLLLAAGVLALLGVWGLYESAWETVNRIIDAGFTLGQHRVAVGQVLLAAVALYAALLVSWLLRVFLDEEVFVRRGVERGVGESIKTLLHYALIVVGFFVALTLAGFDLSNLAILAGAFGIGIGFGLQNVVSNFVSGLILLFERPIRPGDVVVLDGQWGVVQRIGLRSTVVRTYEQSEVIVPNGDLVSKNVVNWTLSDTSARLLLKVGVAYGSDLERVFQILDAVPKEHPKVLAEPVPYAVFTGFGASSLDFELRAWVGEISDRLRVTSELLAEIDRRFREAGIEIPFPQQDLHLRSVDEAAGRRLRGSPQPP